MKRCPQCEFIYEDDQSLCDMDGVLLVFDSRTLPNLHALATVPAVPKTQRRNRAVPAFATLRSRTRPRHGLLRLDSSAKLHTAITAERLEHRACNDPYTGTATIREPHR